MLFCDYVTFIKGNCDLKSNSKIKMKDSQMIKRETKVWYDFEKLARFLFPPESLLCPLFASQRKETALEESRTPSSFSMSSTYFHNIFNVTLTLFDINFNTIDLFWHKFQCHTSLFEIIFNVIHLFKFKLF